MNPRRRRVKRSLVVRLEMRVHKKDVAVVRSVIAALADPDRRTKARALLQVHLGAHRSRGLKALIAAAPLDELELTRDRDLGRDVDL